MRKLLFIFALMISMPKVSAQDKTITTSGDILQMAIPAAALASTFIWKDDTTKPTWQFVKAYGSSLVMQQALKHIVQKPRPDGSDNFSFPSGHTTSAFSGAAFIQRRYGWKYGVPSYLLASFVGYSRIQAKKHDGWDVLAGATIGIGTAYLFTKPYQKKAVDVSLQRINGGFMMLFYYTF
ncbi:phosphatase PAP2 family protein [Flavobacterium sp. SUN046]|uniref:phosphatase PAP2 family protein n=1 Tax=Flavobacterium sp. SUN046 TaxID=3002440 RepID=UPI002DB5B365|nr:phosphatase PAP2 family protein [Flavobacterium sp. SUN046]MEC4049376.1 phosphatase PAP2 family protein [Flavobacterium sp. SUN046]